MIRKPDAHDFSESAAVVAIRDAGTLAVEGARGVRDGTKAFMRTAMLALFGLGFLLSIAAHLGSGGFLLLVGGGIAFATKQAQDRGRRRERDQMARWAEPALAASREAMHGTAAASPMTPVSHDLSVGAVGRSAAKIAVPAILFFPTSSVVGYMAPFTAGAIATLALAMLILARLAGERTVLRYDADTLTVHGLLGEATMLWADVGDLIVRRASWWDWKMLFTSGSRRNLVVLGRHNRLGGPDTLYIPIDLLGLDAAALARLMTRLLALRAGTPLPDAMPAALRPAPLASRSEPASPERPAIAGDSDPFDPDAIMARYLAERAAITAAARPAEPTLPRRPVFGRKVA